MSTSSASAPPSVVSCLLGAVRPWGVAGAPAVKRNSACQSFQRITVKWRGICCRPYRGVDLMYTACPLFPIQHPLEVPREGANF
jgi:hypothetical protein